MNNVRPTWHLAGPLTLLVCCLLPAPAHAQLKLVPFVSGLSQPTGMVQDPSDPTVQYVLEKGGPATPIGTGRIRVIKDGVLRAQPFLELPVTTTGECGLGGLVFAPDYATSRRFYVYHCLPQGFGDTTISRFLRSASDPYAADASTRLDFEFPPESGGGGDPQPERFIVQPSFESIHKAGRMLFGADGYLYVAVGDGGVEHDAANNAQTMTVLRGKILRLDVSVPDSDPKGYRIPPDNPFIGSGLGEIWDLGLRNPWKFSFDAESRGGTGALIIGDVGEDSFEEIDYEPKGKGGRNYQWSLREGMHNYMTGSRTQGLGLFKDPIYEYDHGYGRSIIGGYVYRGTALPALYRGRYFLADFITKKVVSLGLTIDSNGEATVADTIDHTAEIDTSGMSGFTSIDIDSQGELYFVSFNGTIRKLVAEPDQDHDGMDDEWEELFGVTDPNADPDGDGKTNLQEFLAGSHPNNNAAFTRYFAEGATGFFAMTIALANPGDVDAMVNLQFLLEDGSVRSHAVVVSAHRRATVRPNDLPDLAAAAFSTVVESNQEIVAERTMVWPPDVRYGSHTETAVKSPATTWYLAEGSTLGDFSLYYLLENPHPTPTNVEITYLRLAPAPPIAKTYTIPANTRKTIDVQGEAPELADADISGVIRVVGGTNGIIVERAMYLSGGGQLWRAGHDAAGVTAPSTHWFFAEGATGGFFDMFLLLANPGATKANVTLTFLQPDGTSPITVQDVVEPSSRKTLNPEGLDPALANTAMSTIIQSDQPIVAERAMYWPGLDTGGWLEGADSPGATETGQAWVVADGERGGAYATETFVLIANTSAFAGRARVTLLMEDGTTVAPVDVDLLPNSRVNAPDFASATNGKRYSVLVESIPLTEGGTPAEIVVERATYSNDSNGVFWSAGGGAFGTKIR